MSEGVNNDTPATAGEEQGSQDQGAVLVQDGARVEVQVTASVETASETPDGAPVQEAEAEAAAEALEAAEAEARLPPAPPSAPAAPLPQVEETPVIHKHFVAPALIPLERIDEDADFLIRDEA